VQVRQVTVKRTIAAIGMIAAMGISWAFGSFQAEREFRTYVPNSPNLVICDMTGEPDCWPLPDKF
jgi:hypothetical protein